MIRALCMLLLAGCSADAFTSSIGDASSDGDASPLEDGDVSPDVVSDASPVDAEGGSDASFVDAEGSVADAGACPNPYPMIGAGCSPVGLRACRSETIVWYCGGTWTSNACTQNNPQCGMYADGGLYCKGPVCP